MFIDDGGDVFPGRDDNDQIGRRGQVAQARIAFPAGDFLVARIDDVNHTAETRGNEIVEHRPSGRSHAAARADQRQGFRLKGLLQTARAHRCSPEEPFTRNHKRFRMAIHPQSLTDGATTADKPLARRGWDRVKSGRDAIGALSS
jgi:hypothetical protein